MAFLMCEPSARVRSSCSPLHPTFTSSKGPAWVGHPKRAPSSKPCAGASLAGLRVAMWRRVGHGWRLAPHLAGQRWLVRAAVALSATAGWSGGAAADECVSHRRECSNAAPAAPSWLQAAEVLEGEKAAAASDMYSFGMVGCCVARAAWLHSRTACG